VRSSSTSEDSDDASFAGLQQTYLNISNGPNLFEAIKRVFASLYNTRAISYRSHRKLDERFNLISVGIQPMIRSDKAVSGVMFTIDPESGFDDVIVINATYGLGEGVVQGSVTPDEFVLYKPSLLAGKSAILKREIGTKKVKMIYGLQNKPEKSTKMIKVSDKARGQYCLSDQEMTELAMQAIRIEKHYKKSMDIEWAKDGVNGKMYILQARPETVKSREKSLTDIERYSLQEKSKVLTTGHSIGHKIGAGRAKILSSPKKLSSFKRGDVLVTDMTDPDWEPIMKQASAIVTNRGGRTCHAAIIARELGVPAIVGCENATKVIKNGTDITVDCAEGHIGFIYSGKLPFTVKRFSISSLPKLPVKLCLNIGNPEIAFVNRSLPHSGVGLARLEFIISSMIGIHPKAILAFPKLDAKLKKKIYQKTSAYSSPKEYYIERLREGMSQIAAAYAPFDAIFRFSDFKSNEYANLLGGEQYEPHEENPMIGFRGASRYRDPSFKDCFELECIAIKRLREEMDILNAQVMIPFVRTTRELEEVLKIMQSHGLRRNLHGLKIYMMCEIPSNVILADNFLPYIDGFSIGSNDLTQLTLGLDRDSGLLANEFDERDLAVKEMIKKAIRSCKRHNKYIGICGQGPSDHPDFAKWLMQEKIDAISLNPDTIMDTWLKLAEYEHV